MKKVKLGKYQHYKGGLYRVIAQGKIEATLEDVVIYETLYNNPLGKIWVRPVTNFLEEVTVEGKKQPRFKFIE